MCNNIEIVHLLAQHGADISLENKRGERPYSIAAKNDNREMMEL